MYIFEILSLSVALQKGFGEVDGCNFVVAALMCTELWADARLTIHLTRNRDIWRDVDN